MNAPATGPAPRWVRILAVVAVIVVAAVAAVASYAHMRTVGQRAGEGWRADMLPLSVDGLLVAASLVLLVRRRAGLPAGWLSWCGLALGITASLAANVAAAEPTALGRIVAAWPPLAFAVSFELLVIVLRDSSAGTAALAAGEAGGLPGEDTDDLVSRAAALVTAGRQAGEPIGRARLARELEVSEHRARGLLDQVGARNGAGPEPGR